MRPPASNPAASAATGSRLMPGTSAIVWASARTTVGRPAQRRPTRRREASPAYPRRRRTARRSGSSVRPRPIMRDSSASSTHSMADTTNGGRRGQHARGPRDVARGEHETVGGGGQRPQQLAAARGAGPGSSRRSGTPARRPAGTSPARRRPAARPDEEGQRRVEGRACGRGAAAALAGRNGEAFGSASQEALRRRGRALDVHVLARVGAQVAPAAAAGPSSARSRTGQGSPGCCRRIPTAWPRSRLSKSDRQAFTVQRPLHGRTHASGSARPSPPRWRWPRGSRRRRGARRRCRGRSSAPARASRPPRACRRRR